MPSKKPIESGTKFGRWTVLETIYLKTTTKLRVRCDCGNESTVSRNNIARGKSLQCRSCYLSKREERREGIGEMSGTFWGAVRRNAKCRDLELNITMQEAYDLFLKQEGKCALSGVVITLDNYNRGSATASLDRIDSSKSYDLSNMQWVHKELNVMKLDTDNSKFIEWCKLVAKNN